MPNNVTFELPEYKDMLEEWRLMDDVSGGQRAIKKQGELYLPKPNPSDTSDENTKRYGNYLKRSVFYNLTGRTIRGLVGSVFKKLPEYDFPSRMRYIEKNIDGKGNSIFQQSQKVTTDVLKHGRCGLFVDVMGEGNPRITTYNAKSIINWQTSVVGDEKVLTKVVLAEKEEILTEDGFGVKSEKRWRELALVNGLYVVNVWRKSDDKEKEYEVVDTYEPSIGKQSGRLTRIPFVFAGSVNNDHEVDPAPLYDMAELNVAHYRNSADFEDNAFFLGQAQAWMSGLDDEWVEMLKNLGIYIGSRTPIPLPVGGSFGIEQVKPNTMVKEAMDGKEKQMVALGAHVVERGSGSKTATQERNENTVEYSVLSLIVENVSDAYESALEMMAEFLVIQEESTYQLNSDFESYTADPQLITAVKGLYDSSLVPEEDMWDFLRKIGVIRADKENEDIREEIESNPIGLELDE